MPYDLVIKDASKFTLENMTVLIDLIEGDAMFSIEDLFSQGIGNS